MVENLVEQARLAAEKRQALRGSVQKRIERSFGDQGRPDFSTLGPSTPFKRNNIGSTYGDPGRALPKRYLPTK